MQGWEFHAKVGSLLQHSPMRKKTVRGGPVLGMGWFTAISAVEGIRLTEGMRKDFETMQRTGLSTEDRLA
jgi:hypothetical protein